MNRTLVAAFLAVALVAGAAGGLASRFWNAPSVFAQESPKSVSAQSFIFGEQRGRKARHPERDARWLSPAAPLR